MTSSTGRKYATRRQKQPGRVVAQQRQSLLVPLRNYDCDDERVATTVFRCHEEKLKDGELGGEQAAWNALGEKGDAVG